MMLKNNRNLPPIPITSPAEEDAADANQPAGVRQSARITFSDVFKPPRAKRNSLSAQVLEKHQQEEERVVEGQVASMDNMKIEGNASNSLYTRKGLNNIYFVHTTVI